MADPAPRAPSTDMLELGCAAMARAYAPYSGNSAAQATSRRKADCERNEPAPFLAEIVARFDTKPAGRPGLWEKPGHIGLWRVKDGRFDLPDGRLSGVRLTFSSGRTTAVADPNRTAAR
jgi:hypothetical protein